MAFNSGRKKLTAQNKHSAAMTQNDVIFLRFHIMFLICHLRSDHYLLALQQCKKSSSTTLRPPRCNLASHQSTYFSYAYHIGRRAPPHSLPSCCHNKQVTSNFEAISEASDISTFEQRNNRTDLLFDRTRGHHLHGLLRLIGYNCKRTWFEYSSLLPGDFFYRRTQKRRMVDVKCCDTTHHWLPEYSQSIWDLRNICSSPPKRLEARKNSETDVGHMNSQRGYAEQ